jgi:hypothetical protein
VEVLEILFALLFASETFDIHITVQLDIALSAIEVVSRQVFAGQLVKVSTRESF